MLLIIIWYFFHKYFWSRFRPQPPEIGLGLVALASASASRFWPRLTSLAAGSSCCCLWIVSPGIEHTSTGWAKKLSHILLSISSPNTGRFSTFFTGTFCGKFEIKWLLVCHHTLTAWCECSPYSKFARKSVLVETKPFNRQTVISKLNLPVFLLSVLHLSRKYLRFFSTVLSSSLTINRSPPGFWKYVLLSLFLPLPTLSICLSPQVSSILFSKNLLARLFSRNLH